MNCVSAAVTAAVCCRGHSVQWEIEIENKTIGTRLKLIYFYYYFPYFMINTILLYYHLLSLVNDNNLWMIFFKVYLAYCLYYIKSSGIVLRYNNNKSQKAHKGIT